MTLDLAHLAPFIWVAAAILVVMIAFLVIRFFWRHVILVALRLGLLLLLVVAVLALLRFLGII